MMDGSLEEDGKTPADYEYNARVTKEVVADGPSHKASASKVNSVALVRWRSGEGEQEDGHGAVGELSFRMISC